MSYHIQCAKKVTKYVADCIPDTQKTAKRAARHDILAIILDTVNRALVVRLQPVLDINSRLFLSASRIEIHSTIMFFTRYQHQL